jgi:hypothetical protein
MGKSKFIQLLRLFLYTIFIGKNYFFYDFKGKSKFGIYFEVNFVQKKIFFTFFYWKTRIYSVKHYFFYRFLEN